MAPTPFLLGGCKAIAFCGGCKAIAFCGDMELSHFVGIWSYRILSDCRIVGQPLRIVCAWCGGVVVWWCDGVMV